MYSMTVMRLSDRLPFLTSLALPRSEKSATEPQREEKGSKFSAFLERATAGAQEKALTVGEREKFLQAEFRRHMTMTMLDALRTGVTEHSFPGHGEVLNAFTNPPPPSNNRQERSSSDAHRGPEDLDAIIDRAARRFEVDPALIRSVIKAESNFNAAATSPAGAMGLMQLMPGTASDMGFARPYDPEENIMGGVQYLKLLLNRYDGDLERTLAAYNWGMGNVDKKTGRLPSETRTYIARVLQNYERYRA